VSALFAEPTNRFAVRLDPAAVDALHIFAAAAHPLETGGALVGYYDGDKLAVVTEVLGPPADTVHGPRALVLGADGLAEYFAAIWPARHHLGDWHTHPGESPPIASPTDHATMRAHTLGDAALSCILGGTPGAYALSVTVYERGNPVALRAA
jgi:hypothetical protein